ncbi:hypothetical protein [Caldalkalibacillus salinus]|uniref:hypothetical protein n=1 Tax=Caldalkalibacillus salinus TaxID=2803787 RepID=UPI001924ADFE|nr:hypothetical protein [Caldalkalibacillus salinus]
MNNEMLLMQARQDFIDVHKDLLTGQKVPLYRYDNIVSDLQRMDDINIQMILDFVQQTEDIDIEVIWKEVGRFIEEVKSEGRWVAEKERYISWRDGKIHIT